MVQKDLEKVNEAFRKTLNKVTWRQDLIISAIRIFRCITRCSAALVWIEA